jgi:predicted GNAT family acetyltransferase
MADPIALRAVDVPGSLRYELFADGELAGFLTYRLNQGVITLVHTEIADGYKGHGLGERLAQFALDDARRRGLTVRPECPFVRHYVKDHSEYRDLVAPDFELAS